jgi:hypothetical protein
MHFGKMSILSNFLNQSIKASSMSQTLFTPDPGPFLFSTNKFSLGSPDDYSRKVLMWAPLYNMVGNRLSYYPAGVI